MQEFHGELDFPIIVVCGQKRGDFLRNVGKSDENVGISIKDVGKKRGEKRGGKRGEIPTLEIPKSLGKFHMYGLLWSHEFLPNP